MKILIGFTKRVYLVVCIVFFSSTLYANDLGKLGKSYPIVEPDLIETIKKMLMEKQDNGELDEFNNEWAENAKGYVRSPPGKSLPRATAYRDFAIDPTFTVQNDILDGEGNVLYYKGFTFNPLLIKPLTQTLCFIDGDDPDQIEWLKTHCGEEHGFKRILIDGDFYKASEYLNMRLYFDQNSVLLTHFRLEAVPAVVRQSGDILYVEEFEI